MVETIFDRAAPFAHERQELRQETETRDNTETRQEGATTPYCDVGTRSVSTGTDRDDACIYSYGVMDTVSHHDHTPYMEYRVFLGQRWVLRSMSLAGLLVSVLLALLEAVC